MISGNWNANVLYRHKGYSELNMINEVAIMHWNVYGIVYSNMMILCAYKTLNPHKVKWPRNVFGHKKYLFQGKTKQNIFT